MKTICFRQTFNTLNELVEFHRHESMQLHVGNTIAGTTCLTCWPEMYCDVRWWIDYWFLQPRWTFRLLPFTLIIFMCAAHNDIPWECDSSLFITLMNIDLEEFLCFPLNKLSKPFFVFIVNHRGVIACYLIFFPNLLHHQRFYRSYHIFSGRESLLRAESLLF